MTRRKKRGSRSKLRSRLEDNVATYLNKTRVEYTYETSSFRYRFWLPNTICSECGGESKAFKWRTYTPDFFLPNEIIIEAKGKMGSPERKKLIAIKEEHPDMDLRLLFMRDNKIHRMSKTRYSVWAEKNGFPWTVSEEGVVPENWIKDARRK
jgi:hypothetical protein